MERDCPAVRLKAALIIIAIVLVITAVNFGSSLMLTRDTLNVTMSEDLSIALDIANESVSMRIRLYKSNAQTAAVRLARVGSPEAMKTVMRELLVEFPDFMAFTVFGRQGILAEYGDSPTSINWLDQSKYVESAFNGQTIISTTSYNEKAEKLVMHICTPMGHDTILSVTISGMIFSELLGSYILRDTRSVFMLDEYGTMIAHFLPELVTSRINLADSHTPVATVGNNLQVTTDFFREMLMKDKGLGNYIRDGVEYQCAYAKITASTAGWYIALSVPMSENLVVKLQDRLMLLAIIFFAAGALAAGVSSGLIAKPYNKIAEQNRRLEELNEISCSQNEKILEAHQVTKLMMDATPICSMLWDRQCNIIDCNEETVKTFGMKDTQDFLDHFFDFSPEYQSNGRSSRDLVLELINKTFEDGRVSSEWMHQLQDGTPVQCEMTFVRVRKNTDYIVAAYARDLRTHNRMMAETRRLQTELEVALKEAQDANRAKTSFLANMSHDMRTPLNAVLGLSELILNTGEPKRQAEWNEIKDRLEKIYSSGMTLLGLVNDILDISKIESGKYELHPIKYDTASLINDIVSLNIVRIGEKPIQFILTIDENLPGQLSGDDLRIKQIFNNLLSNAFKYTNSGTVEWKMSFERDGDTIWLISDIKDTGMGIRSEDIEKLFEDYRQVDAQINRRVESTGLGLSITKRLAGMMNGDITVKSEYGKGSTFSVRLRQRFVSDIPIGKETAALLMNANFTDNKRDRSANLKRIDLSYASVLVVDDMPTNLDVAKGMLKPYGVRVDCAGSGRQAIDMITACGSKENPRYDAVFMDHMMPGMNGIEAVRVIREELGTDYARTVPIIALTANAITGNENMFLGHGFQAFISKPIDTLRLDSILRRWVRDKNREEELGIQNSVQNLSFHTEQSDPPSGGIAIAGVDTDAGLKRFAGNEEEYLKVLKSYTENTRPLLGDMEKSLASGDLSAYAVTAHGIKGASFGIGASSAGSDAEQLEKLAKAGEAEQAAALNSAFIASMTRLLDSIDSALSAYSAQDSKPVAAAPDPALLRELREACDEYDVRRIDRIMSLLESFEYENGSELVAWLHKQVEDMNFREISGGAWPVFPTTK